MACPAVLLSLSQPPRSVLVTPEQPHLTVTTASWLQCCDTAGIVPILCRREAVTSEVSSDTCQAFVTSRGSPPASPLVLV